MNSSIQATPLRADVFTFLRDKTPSKPPSEQRVYLDVTLLSDCHGTPNTAREHLRRLLQSPLCVYIVETSIVGDDVVVRFDIAATDVDFTLHTLNVALPDAMIRRLVSRKV